MFFKMCKKKRIIIDHTIANNTGRMNEQNEGDQNETL